jgi:DNA-directed RNA polymerase beta subunit
MEDAMVINKSSIERGFAHGAIYASEVGRLVCCTILALYRRHK